MNKIKKLISGFLVCCILATMLPATVFAEEIDQMMVSDYATSGTCGENLSWSLGDNGVLSISGTGEMTNYTSGSYPYSSDTRAPWYDLRNLISYVQIETGVTSIGDYAFYDLYNMVEISLPDGISKIGKGAFGRCSLLAGIDLPITIKSIGSSAFFECTSLEYVTHPDLATWCYIDFETGYQGKFNDSNPLCYAHNLYINGQKVAGELIIPEGVTSISQYAFYNCTSLSSISIPESLEVIGYEAFTGCNNLSAVHISNLYNWCEMDFKVSYYHDDIHNYDSNPLNQAGNLYLNGTIINELTIPDGIAEIKRNAFAGATCISKVVLSETVTTVGADAFRACSNLREIALTDYLQIIEACAFLNSGLQTIIIPDSVTNLGTEAFKGCTNLQTVTIGDRVAVLPSEIFSNCTSLQSIALGSGVKQSDHYAFNNCTSLEAIYISDIVQWCNIMFTTSTYGSSEYRTNPLAYGCNLYIDGELLENLQIPTTIDTIAHFQFYGGSCIKTLQIPENIKSIKAWAFHGCSGIKQVTIPESVTEIGSAAFAECSNLDKITILNPECTINNHYQTLGVRNNTTIYGYTGSTAQTYAQNNGYTFVAIDEQSGSDDFSIAGLEINKHAENFYIFLGDPNVYNMDTPNAPLYSTLNQLTVIDNDLITPADITWTSSDESIFQVISGGSADDLLVNLQVEGLSEGTAILTATNPQGESINLEVTVVKPNALEYTNIYDTKQYYYEGAFYSADSGLSDCVEIFVQFGNKQNADYPCEVVDELADNIPNIKPITVTAAVSGTDISFDRDSYQNTYTATYDAISYNQAIYDLMMLFPYSQDTYDVGTRKSYTVDIKIESESFNAPIIETYTFTIYDAESPRVQEHLSFLNDDITYKVSKQNTYGEEMIKLKDDREYQWSKWSTFDFENYYEVVWADIVLSMSDNSSIEAEFINKYLGNYCGTYTTVIKDVATILNDSYADVFDVSTADIDKLMKASKYATDGIYADGVFYQKVLAKFNDVRINNKIKNIFAAVDKTSQVSGYISFGGDVVKEVLDWTNTICAFNTFVEYDEEMKQVFRNIADRIPASEGKMKAAIEDYLNYSQDFSGVVVETFESFSKMSANVMWDTFDTFVGKNVVDWSLSKIAGWIGTKAWFNTIIGSVSTGISLGLCISDLLCDSGDKAAEMGKIIAMSEYAPYIIDTLEYYETNLRNHHNNESVELFESAFMIHKASQSYIMDHTVKALEAKAGSLLMRILGNDYYDELVADILVQKAAIDGMECCSTIQEDTMVHNVKVIAIKCPVDVYLFDESGNELVRIIQDNVEYATDGFRVLSMDGQKYVAMPANQVYSIKIVATDAGTMEYVVMEYNSLEIQRSLRKQDIPLIDDRIFTGEVVEEMGVAPESYALSYDSTEVIPDEISTGSHFFTEQIHDEEHLAVQGDCQTPNQYYYDCEYCDTIGPTTWVSTIYGSHNISNDWTTENGRHYHVCTITGCEHIEDVANCTGGVATCTSQAICEVCGETYGELLAHSYSIEWAKDASVHWHECACGEKADFVKHTSSGATTEDTAEVCTVCGYEIAPELNHTHSYNTLKSDDNKHWYECDCGEKSGETTHSGGTATCTDKAKCFVCGTEYGEAMGHDYANALTAGTDTHYYACSHCGRRKDEAAHSFKWVTDEAATTTTPGIKHEECVCGAKRNENTVIPAMVTTQTGDNSQVALWATLLMTSALALYFLFISKKRKENA